MTTPMNHSPAEPISPRDRKRRIFFGLQTTLIALALSVLACTANDTLFIQLTATPSPTITPTPLAIQTRYTIGQILFTVGLGPLGQALPALPRPIAEGRVGGATCFSDTKVTIGDISKNTGNAQDPDIYYKIQCGGRSAWIPESYLSVFGRNVQAVITTSDGQGAKVYQTATTTGKVNGTCPEGTMIKVSGLSRNDKDPKDTNIYVRVTCDKLSGYVLESALKLAS